MYMCGNSVWSAGSRFTYTRTHTYINNYIHACMHAYTHTFMHTYSGEERFLYRTGTLFGLRDPDVQFNPHRIIELETAEVCMCLCVCMYVCMYVCM